MEARWVNTWRRQALEPCIAWANLGDAVVAAGIAVRLTFECFCSF